MRKSKTENKIVLSHKVKLPKHLNPYLHNLFEKNKTLVNLQLGKLWNEESFLHRPMSLYEKTCGRVCGRKGWEGL